MHCFIVILKLRTYLQFVTVISVDNCERKCTEYMDLKYVNEALQYQRTGVSTRCLKCTGVSARCLCLVMLFCRCCCSLVKQLMSTSIQQCMVLWSLVGGKLTGLLHIMGE
jgi:hypothetical protein